MSGPAGGRTVDAAGDPLRFFRGLRDRDLRREGVLVAEGRLVVSRVAARFPLLAVLAERSAAAEAERLAAESERRFGRRCPVVVLPSAELAAVAGYPFHRGLLAAAERPPMPSLAGSESSAFRRLLVLPEPNDPENLGAMARSAAALGWDACLLGERSCDPWGRRALRCSMGATLSLPLFQASAAEAAAFFSAGSWTVAAAEAVPGALRLGTPEAAALLRASDRLALLIGNERDGVPEDWRALRTASVLVPQARDESSGVDSLNAAAAAAILLWEGRAGVLPEI